MEEAVHPIVAPLQEAQSPDDGAVRSLRAVELAVPNGGVLYIVADQLVGVEPYYGSMVGRARQ